MRMKLAGSNPELVAEGIFENINITNDYVYFNTFNAPTPVLMAPTNETIQVTEFVAAKQALIQ